MLLSNTPIYAFDRVVLVVHRFFLAWEENEDVGRPMGWVSAEKLHVDLV